MSPEDALTLIANNSQLSQVLQPYLNGADQNRHPGQKPSRWVINFGDRLLEDCRQQYPELLEIVERKVKPERVVLKDRGYREKWWQFARRGVALYKAIKYLEKVLVSCTVTKHLSWSFATTDIVYDIATTVVASDSDSLFCILQSTIHREWAWNNGSTMKADLRYTPGDCIETYPFPEKDFDSAVTRTCGEVYYTHRRQLMLQMRLGLTKTYNLFHNPNLSPEVVAKMSKQNAEVATEAYFGLLRLRELHCEMDETVLNAYGWHESSDDGPPIDLRHDFYEVDYLPENDRVRYTINPEARREVLKRLLAENHARAAAEAENPTPKPKRGRRKRKTGDDGPSLFPEET